MNFVVKYIMDIVFLEKPVVKEYIFLISFSAVIVCYICA